MTKVPQTLTRRRVDFFRAAIIVATTAAALILFVIWYKSWPHRLDCARASDRLAAALEDHRKSHHELPSLLDRFEIRAGRHSTDHYTYCFGGTGGRADLPDGTLVAYCKEPHRSAFRRPWRHALVVRDKQIVVQWLPEDQFQERLKQQRPVGPF